ncbi:MAG TPA: hypothetical protein VIG99_22850 [Myxococcaceae bacterium]|jgi:hypothetical protein
MAAKLIGTVLGLSIASLSCVRAPPAQRSGPRPLAAVYAKGLEGDMRAGLKLLEGIAQDELTESDRAKYACMRATFSDRMLPAVNVEDRLMADAIRAYQGYWLQVLLKELDEEAGDAFLLAKLREVLAAHGHPASEGATLDEVVDLLGSQLEERGFRNIHGVTAPYYELMAWKTEARQTYQVALPELVQPTTVVFLSDFATLGWSHLATCGVNYSGGWTKPEALYCVKEAYDVASENFQVSYLAHEAQHFADNRDFPKLEQPELEYRAKLAELSLARDTARTLVQTFGSRPGDSRSAPHNYANKRVVMDLGAAADENVPVPELNAAARALLLRSSEALKRKGAATVTRLWE